MMGSRIENSGDRVLEKELIDRFGRRVTYLRMSVTDRCNYKCTYCMPEGGLVDLGRYNLLTLEELARTGRIFIEEGIRKIRLTGGEPLLRQDLHVLVEQLSQLDGLTDLCMTTNGHLLTEKAETLAKAGLQRVNVSLDSVNPDKFKGITRGGDLSLVLRGLETARNVFPGPVKVNVVVSRGFNDDEILSFARLTLDPGYSVRFIEPIPMSPRASWERGQVLSVFAIREQIAEAFGMEPVEENGCLSGPATRFRIPGAAGELGFIGAVTNEFCQRCNRIRLTPDGKLRGCLMADGEVDLRALLREGVSDDGLMSILAGLMREKPERHAINEIHFIRPQRTMSQIGG